MKMKRADTELLSQPFFMKNGGFFMKRKSFIYMLLFMLLLSSCSNAVDQQDTAPEQAKQNNDDYLADYASNPQVTDDRNLLEVGQSVLDEKGEATLKAIRHINKIYNVGPVELEIKDMKLIHLKPDYSLVDYFHVLTHEEEFDFIKVFVEIRNTSTEKVNFAPIAMIETNTGEKIDWKKDIYLEDLNGKLDGQSTKKGNLGFIIESTDDLEWIEITTSDVFDKNSDKISDSQKIRIEK